MIYMTSSYHHWARDRKLPAGPDSGQNAGKTGK
jgi:hypothetical protein